MRRLVRLFLALLLAAPVAGAAGAQEVALEGATLVDLENAGRSRRDIRDSVVLIRDGRIVAAGPRGGVKVPADARRVDLRGKWLVPGFIDGFSAQLDESHARAHLAMGVTTISQTEDRDNRRGRYVPASPQPNMRRLGTVTGRDGAGLPENRTWNDLYERGRRLSNAELAVDMDRQAAGGAAGVMLMYPLDDAQVAAAIAHARKRGLFTIGEFGHASYRKAATAGVDTLVHTSRIEAELAPPDLRALIASRPFAPPDHPISVRYSRFLAELDTRSPAFRAYAAELARRGTTLMPTLAIATTHLPDTPDPWRSPVGPLIEPATISHLPFDRATGRATVPPEAPGDYVAVRQARARKSLETMHAFHRAGVRFLAGSGATAFGVIPGWGLHRELALLVRSGLTPREAVAAATTNYADAYRWRAVGRIAPGYRADLVVLAADPTRDIAAAQKIDTVYLAGERLDRAALLAWRSTAP